MDSLKKKVKRALDRKTGFDSLKASQLPESAEYVSFDIFDTLVLRKTGEPKSVFSLLERKLRIPNFCEKRIAAERTARKKKPSGEVTLREIYNSFGGLSESEIDKYCKLELKAELSVCVPNRRLIGFYRHCLKSRNVILISDMYLPKDMMKQLLDKCGMTGYKELYISCEAGANKRSGELYKYVLDDLGISPKKIVHIGNDFMTDIICAGKKGIRSIKIKTHWSRRNEYPHNK